MVRGKRIHTAKWRRCVTEVRGKVNPYAVCTASLGRKAFLKYKKAKTKYKKAKRHIRKVRRYAKRYTDNSGLRELYVE